MIKLRYIQKSFSFIMSFAPRRSLTSQIGKKNQCSIIMEEASTHGLRSIIGVCLFCDNRKKKHISLDKRAERKNWSILNRFPLFGYVLHAKMHENTCD